MLTVSFQNNPREEAVGVCKVSVVTTESVTWLNDRQHHRGGVILPIQCLVSCHPIGV
jgi:hypothetical protein